MNSISLFLLSLFSENFSYSTLNIVRSALSFFLCDRLDIGSNDFISRLFKYFYKTRPSFPRYFVSWDINILLNFLMSWHPSSALSLEKLTLKTVSLVAVTSSDRAQTLEALDIEHCSFSDEAVRFPIYSLLKTSRKNRPVKVVCCYKSENPQLDVCEYVSSYMTRTLKFRLKAVRRGCPKPTQLFLSYFTGKPIKRATISKYILKTMELAGLDVQCYKAHSVRGALPSRMSTAGASAHDIISQGDWKHVSTFDRFYRRLPDDSPAGLLIQEVVGRRRN